MPRKSEFLEELTALIGYGETIALLRAWGGRRLRVPKGLDPAPGCEHPLVLAVGWEAANKLAHTYGGDELELPAERNALMEVRNDAIVRDLGEGVSVRETAFTYGLTPRHVRYIRQCYEKDHTGETRAEI